MENINDNHSIPAVAVSLQPESTDSSNELLQSEASVDIDITNIKASSKEVSESEVEQGLTANQEKQSDPEAEVVAHTSTVEPELEVASGTDANLAAASVNEEVNESNHPFFDRVEIFNSEPMVADANIDTNDDSSEIEGDNLISDLESIKDADVTTVEIEADKVLESPVVELLSSVLDPKAMLKAAQEAIEARFETVNMGETVELALDGLTPKEIAALLGLTRATDDKNWFGRNHLEDGATTQGFFLFDSGRAWDRKLEKNIRVKRWHRGLKIRQYWRGWNFIWHNLETERFLMTIPHLAHSLTGVRRLVMPTLTRKEIWFMRLVASIPQQAKNSGSVALTVMETGSTACKVFSECSTTYGMSLLPNALFSVKGRRLLTKSIRT